MIRRPPRSTLFPYTTLFRSAALWGLATPEMAGYIQEELNENASNGVVNTVANVRLVQGDLAEAWREGESDYATVAMRDRKSTRLNSSHANISYAVFCLQKKT